MWRYPLLLPFFLISPALAMAQSTAAVAGSQPATQAQIAELQQAVQNAQTSGDNAWMLMSAALVLLMTGPGLALFYGGLVRRKNILGTMMQSFAMMGLVTILWAIVGYSLAFGHGNAFIGGLRAPVPARRGPRPLGLRDHHSRADLHGLPAHVRHHHAGAHHGGLRRTHEIQRHGGVPLPVVALCLQPDGAHGLGRGRAAQRERRSFSQPRLRRRHRGPHHLGRLGAGDRALSRQAHRLSQNRHAAALAWCSASSAPACCGWAGSASMPAAPSTRAAGHQRLRQHALRRGRRRPRLDHRRVDPQRQAHRAGRRSPGAVAGLVAITPASGFVQPMSALLIGVLAGIFCSFMVFEVKSRFGYDDSLDAFGVHGAGGTLGAMLTGIFAVSVINPAFGNDPSGKPLPTGGIDGHWGQMREPGRRRGHRLGHLHRGHAGVALRCRQGHRAARLAGTRGRRTRPLAARRRRLRFQFLNRMVGKDWPRDGPHGRPA